MYFHVFILRFSARDTSIVDGDRNSFFKKEKIRLIDLIIKYSLILKKEELVMKQNNCLKKNLFVMSLVCLSTNAVADLTVNKSSGVLRITSDISGTVEAKVISPDNEVVVDESYSGFSFNWAPSNDLDGAYRYEVRVYQEGQNFSSVSGELPEKRLSVSTDESDYAGGSVEIKNGQIVSEEEVLRR